MYQVGYKRLGNCVYFDIWFKRIPKVDNIWLTKFYDLYKLVLAYGPGGLRAPGTKPAQAVSVASHSPFGGSNIALAR